MSHILCWFIIGLLGLLASIGVAIPGDVNVAMAIVVPPVNSALNPFLYTFNTILEKRRRLEESRLNNLLLAKLRNQKFVTEDNESGQYTEEQAWGQFVLWMDRKILTNAQVINILSEVEKK